MADLGYTDTQWQRLLEEPFFFVRVLKVLASFSRRFKDNRERHILQSVALDELHAGNALTGVVPIGASQNTDVNGDLWLVITGAGPYTVSLYNAASGGTLQAQGSAAAGATVTMAEQNSSGISGTLRLPSTVFTVAQGEVKLSAHHDFTREVLIHWDGTHKDDGPSRVAAEDMLADLAALFDGAARAIVTGALDRFATGDDKNPRGRMQEALSSIATTVFTETEDRDGNDNVVQLVDGWFVDLKQAMADETTGSTQDVAERVTARAAASFESSNTGSGTVSSGAGEDRAIEGTWTFECVSGLGNGGGGNEEFTGTFQYADTDETATAAGLFVGKTYDLPLGGGQITLARTLSKTGDGSNNDIGAATSFAVSGENEDNTTSGDIWLSLVANGSNFDYEFYSDSGLTDLVSKATNVAASATNVTATAQGSNGITFTFDAGGSPTATNTVQIHFNYFSVNGNNVKPDRFTIAITETSSGEAQDLAANLLGAELNATTAGAEQVADGPLAIVNAGPRTLETGL